MREMDEDKPLVTAPPILRLALTEIPEGTPRIPGALPDEIILRIINGTITAEEVGALLAAQMH